MPSDKTDKLTTRKNTRLQFLFILTLALVIGLAISLFKLYERENPVLTLPADNHFGSSGDLVFTARDARSGIREITVVMRQKDKKVELFSKQFKRQGYFAKSGPNLFEDTLAIKAGELGFDDGNAELLFTVRDFSFWNWLAGNITTEKYPVTIDTTPPTITLLQAPRYISNGGSGLVIYRLDEAPASHGVMVNDHFFKGFPVRKESPGYFLSYIALPYDASGVDSATVTASDRAGNSGSAALTITFKPDPISRDTINISTGFLNKKIPEFAQYYPQLSGSLIDQYVMVNNQIREENYRDLVAITATAAPEQFWQGRFLRMAGKKMAGFAEARDYFFDGSKIDEQTHLGFDIASTRQAPIKAANRGQVMFTGYLGIYGNTVVLDHGQGLASLYSHLSRITVEKGAMVNQDEVIGMSGTTGMAGGDHLHFSVLVNGIFVSPLEWWDRQWLELNIIEPLDRVNAALKTEQASQDSAQTPPQGE